RPLSARTRYGAGHAGTARRERVVAGPRTGRARDARAGLGYARSRRGGTATGPLGASRNLTRTIGPRNGRSRSGPWRCLRGHWADHPAVAIEPGGRRRRRLDRG